MRVIAKCLRSILVIGIILMVAVVLVPIAFADKPSPGVFPPDSNPFGKKYKEWSAEWWQFVFSIPSSENPLFDETGDKCVVGQHGPVWFLVGVLNVSGTAVRNCSIPEGEALFFPVINTEGFNSPNLCGQDSTSFSVAQLQALVAKSIDSATDLSVEVDGNPVQNLQEKFRIKSNLLAIALSEDNVFIALGATPCPAGIYSPNVDEGFYVMLKPLSVGNHTLRIRGKLPGFSLDVTYNLTVVPVQLE